MVAPAAMLLVVALSIGVITQPAVAKNSAGPKGPHGPNGTYTKNGLTWSDKLRMNQIQVIGTHNSYHREVTRREKPFHALLLKDPENYYYSHAALDVQAEYQSVRGFELDIWADPDGGKYATPLIRQLAHLDPPLDPAMNKSGTKVLHVSDADVGTTCYTLVECLQVVKAWSRAHPDHVPIPHMIEFKKAGDDMVSLGGAASLPWNDTDLLAALDAEFRSVFSPDEMITPDDIRRDGLTLEESVLQHGWPDLDSSRGRVMFLMDDGPPGVGDVHAAYAAGRPNLEGRVLFTQAVPGQAGCAFQKLNMPGGGGNLANIQEQVRRGYWVRTRADVPISTVLVNDTDMRDAAFASGAQLVSTDWPACGMSARYDIDYVVRFPGGKAARCNPITAPDSCTDETELEPAEYTHR